MSTINIIKRPVVSIDQETGYFTNIQEIRDLQYPQLATTTYLDHAGTTLYAKSLIETFSEDLTQGLYGNPHSASASSQLSTRRIEDARLQVLRFFEASPDDFEVVFTANATAAIKIVGDAFRDNDAGFRYGYHLESHTSLVGVRELASNGSFCFADGEELDSWLSEFAEITDRMSSGLALAAYPGQSNMTGRRFSFDWSRRIRSLRQQYHKKVYTLYDAAAAASTSPLDLSDLASVPDFIAISFYKIFGFPDLGALLVRRDSTEVLRQRRYFGGGTVDSVGVLESSWHAKKESISARLEDGTLPFHSVLALLSALKIHMSLYGSMHNIGRHTEHLTSQLEDQMRNLKHGNGRPICEFYTTPIGKCVHSIRGPVLAFNLINCQGEYISAAEVEKLAIVNDIQFRIGGLCNPGGIASHLRLSGEELRQNYASGYRCGSDKDLINGKPTGAIRISLGAMSSLQDVTSFLNFVKEYYVEPSLTMDLTEQRSRAVTSRSNQWVVESLAVFPIKSCAAFKIPPDTLWEVGRKGLSWDREWCLVHEGTHVALSQKRYPRMALLYPTISIEENTLQITHNIHGTRAQHLTIPLDDGSLCAGQTNLGHAVTRKSSSICGEAVEVEHYISSEIVRFFTDALEVPCTLARLPRDGAIHRGQVRGPIRRGRQETSASGKPIHLSNESPILLISRSSVNRLNEEIKQRSGAGKAVSADSFRGNIVLGEELQGGRQESPYAEDGWQQLRIGREGASFEVLGPCQRCQMVCVDQKDASRKREPFSTLSMTRRRAGRVWFGMHMCLAHTNADLPDATYRIQVGDRIIAS